jgi:hypothetical protein
VGHVTAWRPGPGSSVNYDGAIAGIARAAPIPQSADRPAFTRDNTLDGHSTHNDASGVRLAVWPRVSSVDAIGPGLSYTTLIDKTQVTLNLRYAVSGNHPSLWWFCNQARWFWLKTLKRRSGLGRLQSKAEITQPETQDVLYAVRAAPRGQMG